MVVEEDLTLLRLVGTALWNSGRALRSRAPAGEAGGSGSTTRFLKNATRWEFAGLLRLVETALRSLRTEARGSPGRWDYEEVPEECNALGSCRVAAAHRDRAPGDPATVIDRRYSRPGGDRYFRTIFVMFN